MRSGPNLLKPLLMWAVAALLSLTFVSALVVRAEW